MATVSSYFHTPEEIIKFLIDEVKSGKSVLVSGKTGVGKSTLTNILKSYSPIKGLCENKDTINDELTTYNAYGVLESAKKGEQVVRNLHAPSAEETAGRMAKLVVNHELNVEHCIDLEFQVWTSIDYVIYLAKTDTGFNYIENITRTLKGGKESKVIFNQELLIDIK